MQQLKSVLSFPKKERSPKILAAFYETNSRAKYSLGLNHNEILNK
jgi:hypothetical protein